MKDLNDLRRERATFATAMQEHASALSAFEADNAAADDAGYLAAQAAFDAAKAGFDKSDVAVKRAEDVERATLQSAQAENDAAPIAVPAVAQNPAEQGVDAGLMIHALAKHAGNLDRAVGYLEQEGHSALSASLSTADPSAGGVTIPQAQSATLIEMLRPRVVVRALGARVVPMPAGQLRRARQASGASANYVGELSNISTSEPSFDAVDQQFKTLTAMVPISNSLLQFSSVAVGAMVRDDMLKCMAAKEDISFLRASAGGNTPTGLKTFCLDSNWKVENGKDYAAVEPIIRMLVSLVEDADVAMVKPAWGMRASTKNFLASLQYPSTGAKVFPSIEASGTLMGFPIGTTSQIANNLGVDADETEIYFADFNEIVIGDAQVITLASSTEAAYVDTNGVTQSAFQRNETLMRAIGMHDLAPMHDEAISGATVKGWSL